MKLVVKNPDPETMERLSEILTSIWGMDIVSENGNCFETEDEDDIDITGGYCGNIEDIVLKVVGRFPNIKFFVSGVIDDEDHSGMCQNYRITVDNGTEVKLSQWYQRIYMDDFDSYEDFCDEFDDILSVDEFENLQGKVLLLDEDGEIIEELEYTEK